MPDPRDGPRCDRTTVCVLDRGHRGPCERPGGVRVVTTSDVEHSLFGVSPPCKKGAILSDCRTYRYQLWRGWSDERPALFIGMNPSTADAEQDDPTIRRCIRFARDWGYGGLLMGNLFAFRATDPKLLPSSDPMPDGETGDWADGAHVRVNDEHLRLMASRAGIVVAAWGAIKMPKGWENQPDRVRELIDGMHALGLTKDGHPRHPLYVKADASPLPLDILKARAA